MSDASVNQSAGMKLRGAAEDVVDAAQKQADIAVVASSNKMVASVGRAGNAATAHVSKFEDGLDRAQNKMFQKMEFCSVPFVGSTLNKARDETQTTLENAASKGLSALKNKTAGAAAAVAFGITRGGEKVVAATKELVRKEVRDPIVHKFLLGDVHFGPQFQGTSDGTFCGDFRFYWKNQHELFSICFAHEHNPLRGKRRCYFVTATWFFASFLAFVLHNNTNCESNAASISSIYIAILLTIFSTVLQPCAICRCCSGDGYVCCRKFFRWLGKFLIIIFMLVNVGLTIGIGLQCAQTDKERELCSVKNANGTDTSCACTPALCGWPITCKTDDRVTKLNGAVINFMSSKAISLLIYANFVLFVKFSFFRHREMKRQNSESGEKYGRWKLNPLEHVRNEDGQFIDPNTGADRSGSVHAMTHLHL